MRAKGTILIVDDNEAILTSLKILLHDVFAHVCTTPHPHTIPSLLRTERPAAVLRACSATTKRGISRIRTHKS